MRAWAGRDDEYTPFVRRGSSSTERGGPKNPAPRRTRERSERERAEPEVKVAFVTGHTAAARRAVPTGWGC